MSHSLTPLSKVNRAHLRRFLALGALGALALSCSDEATSGPAAAGATGQAAGNGSGGTAGSGATGGGTAGGGSPSAGSANAAGSASGGAGSGSGGSSAGAGAGASGGSGGASGGGNTGGGAAGAAGSGGSATSACAGKQYILCEDFESTAEGAVPTGWTKQGQIGVATDQAKSGTKSLKVGNPENGARRIARSATDLGAAHFGRLFYRVQQPVPAVNPSKNNGNTVIHSTIVGLTGPRPAGGTAEYRVLDTIMNQSKKHNFIYNVQIQGGSEFGHETAYTYDYTDAWTCAEWQVDNTAKSYTLYINDMDVTGVKVVNDKAVNGGNNAELPASFTQMNIGWYNYQAGDGGFTVWIDNIAIDDARIGCTE